MGGGHSQVPSHHQSPSPHTLLGTTFTPRPIICRRSRATGTENVSALFSNGEAVVAEMQTPILHVRVREGHSREGALPLVGRGLILPSRSLVDVACVVGV